MSRPAYRFRALNAAGDVETGTLVGESERDAYRMLTARGLLPVALRKRELREARRAPLPVRDLALGLRILADLLDAGLPVSRALASFEELAPKSWTPALPVMRDAVKEGRTLASALADSPVDVPPLVIGIARAGEAGAGVAPAIRRAAEITESSAAMRSAIRSALIYPTILAVAGIGAIGVLIGVVLPRFAKILADLGQALPRSTQLVIQGSLIARRAFIPMLTVTVLGAVAFQAWMQSDRGRETWHALLLRIPLIGAVRAAAATARATASLGTLLETGVPLRQALTFAAKASGDGAVERRVLAARDRIAAGQPIAVALRATGAFTPVAVRLTDAGEQSGRVATMLAHAGKVEQERADRLTHAAVQLLEPALILIFSGVVGFVAAALLQAVYSVRPT